MNWMNNTLNLIKVNFLLHPLLLEMGTEVEIIVNFKNMIITMNH